MFSSFVCLVQITLLFSLCFVCVRPCILYYNQSIRSKPLPSFHPLPPFVFLKFFFSYCNGSICRISPYCHLLLLLQPSSSTNALVLSGACDPPEPAQPAPKPTPSTATETETAAELETTTTSSSLPAFAPSSPSFSAVTPGPIRHASSSSSYSTPSITTTAAAAAIAVDADMDETATPSFMYHAASSSLSASGNSPLRDQ